MEKVDLAKRLEELSEGLRLIDIFVGDKLSDRQRELAQGLIDIFRELRWTLAFDAYKTLKVGNSKPINEAGCGTPVKIRSCRPEHGDKTYFGILLGDIALSVGHSIDKDGNVTANFSGHNPAIFVPELKTIVFGCESWWGEIESEEELSKLITDETISNVWYVKVLREMTKGEKNENKP